MASGLLHAPAVLPAVKSPEYPLERRLGGLQAHVSIWNSGCISKVDTSSLCAHILLKRCLLWTLLPLASEQILMVMAQLFSLCHYSQLHFISVSQSVMSFIILEEGGSLSVCFCCKACLSIAVTDVGGIFWITVSFSLSENCQYCLSLIIFTHYSCSEH